MKKSVVIIGAGPAGLTAAYELLKTSDEYDVLVLEASDHLGGIAATIEHNGNRMDLGGHRFFTKSKEVEAIWKELLLPQTAPAKDEKKHGNNFSEYSNLTLGDPDLHDDVMLVRRRVSRIYYDGKFFDYPIKLNFKLFKTMGFGTTMMCGFSYLKSLIHKLPETSLENFYINRFGKKLYSMFFESYTEKLWGIHPSELDASWGAQRVKGLSIWGVIKNALFKPKNKETSLIERFYYPKFGPGQMWDIMASRIKDSGGDIKFNAKVKGITRNTDNTWSVVYSQNGEDKTIETIYLVSSAPVRDLMKFMGENDSSEGISASRLKYRDFQTVGILAKKLQLINKTKMPTCNSVIPDCWIYVQDKGVTVGRVQIFNNWSPYLLKDSDTCWIGMEYFCTEGDTLWNMSDVEFFNLAKTEIARLGIIAQNDILDMHRVRVHKAYPVYDDAYSDFDSVRTWLDTQENLFCIGRNGQHRYNNLDHSMLTACQAVRAIEGRASKESVWDVNMESEYHEEEKHES